MRYLCIVHVDPGAMSALSPEEKRALDRDSLAYDEELHRKGHFIQASALSRPAAAKIVRVRARKPVITDGPFAESKEVLCGFIFIEARDLVEAVAIAQGIPMARVGTIEVRPELKIGT